jgi:hypothetical protein
MFPFAFKFGSGKGAIVALIIQVSAIFLIPIFEFIKNALNDYWNFDVMFFYKLLREMLVRIADLSAVHAYLFIFSLVIISILISIALSVRYYDRRDL